MPQSKKRSSHKHAHLDYIPHEKKRKSAVPLAILVCTILAIGIALFATGFAPTGIVLALILGATIGYLAGKQMDKSFENV